MAARTGNASADGEVVNLGACGLNLTITVALAALTFGLLIGLILILRVCLIVSDGQACRDLSKAKPGAAGSPRRKLGKGPRHSLSGYGPMAYENSGSRSGYAASATSPVSSTAGG